MKNLNTDEKRISINLKEYGLEKDQAEELLKDLEFTGKNLKRNDAGDYILNIETLNRIVISLHVKLNRILSILDKK